MGDTSVVVQSQVQADDEAKIEESSQNGTDQSKAPSFVQYKWWIQMVIYSTFVLSGQAIGTLLGRLYFDKGGNSKWLATLVQNIGFPILIPFLLITSTKTNHEVITEIQKPSFYVVASLYTLLGLFLAGNCMLYTIGLQYLPVTTYSLICASQLGFNALFSFFLNKQKITPYIVNSLVILTISSSLLVLQNDNSEDQSNKKSRKKYIIGFLSTVAASAGYALMLSITQLALQKIFKRESFRLIIEMSIYQSLVATLAILVGFFASGEWKTMDKEMDEYKLGKVRYVLNLIGTAISWQVFSVGSIGLIFKVSSLFSNVISILGLPIAPVLAVIFLHDKLTGVKVMSMLLAIWGFVSYIYQHYLDDLKDKAAKNVQVVELSESFSH
ncbi:purine permease 21-like isoform X1 [Nicotiana tomentosiformis]|uniref:purine permease 21-like isoform X1 n=1 Tax=Nicotiana tomentosiformis TaxID=4098 RepID=UPI00051CA312|nr:purine permease 21-like isoform X1 [Nicotiana tomentosiformis]